ncbi:MAG: hypothetical protein Q4C95_08740 [Planctomycetia bacterium]|nr:hypothetical protein [Planctomycetia bacterium]
MPKKNSLDLSTRNGVIAIISLGCDIDTAAVYLKKNPKDIYREIKNDKNFELEVKQAEKQAEVYLIKQIKDAASSEKNWRAATWFLERLRPNKYGKNKQNRYSVEKIIEFVSILTNIVIDEISNEDDKQRIQNRFNALLCKILKNNDLKHKSID